MHAVVAAADLDATVAQYIVNDLLSPARSAVAAAKALIARRLRPRDRRRRAAITAAAIAAQRVSRRRPGRAARVSREAQPAVDSMRELRCRDHDASSSPTAARSRVRIIRACREMGIESVAVYSDADAGAPHVARRRSRGAHRPGARAESYLSIAALIDAARAAGADAIHPGYGFLSENAAFAARASDAGLIFVGPPADVDRADGLEDRRARADGSAPACRSCRARRPTIRRDAALRAAVDARRLPGAGQGVGRRRRQGHARSSRDGRGAREAIPAARREATAAFGDGTLYVERLIERPRHVEVQVFADDHGNVVHLFERECSVQRRHQKVIEESPSPALTPELRAAHGRGGRRRGARRRLPQRGHDRVPARGRAATTRAFYFLEMNTRLQVEHPVTEAVDRRRPGARAAAGRRRASRCRGARRHRASAATRSSAASTPRIPPQDFLPQAGRCCSTASRRRPGIRVDRGVGKAARSPSTTTRCSRN